ncbi:MAG: hypothetical protein IPI84_12535 [Holophagaceae bacterium]|nr:hypothetical protein [Holophagaceae bacterium]
MSDKAEKHEKPAPAEAAAEAPAKKSPVKTIGIVAALMIGEAVGVYMVMNATGPKPAEATDVHLEGADEHDTEATVELPSWKRSSRTCRPVGSGCGTPRSSSR